MVKLDLPKEWYEKHINDEGDYDISAGGQEMLDRQKIIEEMAKALYANAQPAHCLPWEKEMFKQPYYEDAEAALKALCRALPSVSDNVDAILATALVTANYIQLKSWGEND